MIAIAAAALHTVLVVSPVVPAVWIDEDFESPNYRRSVLALGEVWTLEPSHQDAVIMDRDSAEYGQYSLFEKKNEGTRHLRVFDSTNSMDGTNDHPLRVRYILSLRRSTTQTYRTCELVNTQTGERIGVGPALDNGFWQVFDGVQWHDLKYCVKRTLGWNTLELTIKTDTIRVDVINMMGRSHEIVPRIKKGTFGAVAVGSGKANKDNPTSVDNILLYGGAIIRGIVSGEGSADSTVPDPVLVQRMTDALQLLEQDEPGPCLPVVESILQDTLNRAEKGDRASKMALPWVYQTVASVKGRLGATPDEIRSVHYEALVNAPEGFGASSAVRGIAATLNDPEKKRFLLNVSAAPTRDLPALEAARILIASQDEASSADQAIRFTTLIKQAPHTLVPEAVVEALLVRGTGDALEREHTKYVARALAGQAVTRGVLVPLGERLSQLGHRHVDERQAAALEQSAQWVEAEQIESHLSIFRRLLFESRMQTLDTWGALAALSDQPLDNGKTELIKALAALDEPSQIEKSLNVLVSQALARDCRIPDCVRNGKLSVGREAVLWEAIAMAAEDARLPRVAMVAYQMLARAGTPISAVDGSPLATSFVSHKAAPERLASFWKAQWLISIERLGLAGQLLEELTAPTQPSSALRAQAAFDLSRVRQSQHRPECATQPAALCASLLPNSQAVRMLKDSVAASVLRQQASARLHEQIGHTWELVQKAKDEKEAADALMAIAELELQLDTPERAAEALEGLLAKYQGVPAFPAAMEKLALIYETRLNKKEEGTLIRERLANAFPGYVGTQRSIH